MTTDIEICNRALQLAGARARITSLATQNHNESFQCNLIFESTRNQLLRMARWNFCRRTINMPLVKAAPGTPENSAVSNTNWTPNSPAPPWLYEYKYPDDCMIFWYVLSQPASVVAINNVPIFSTPTYTYDPIMSGVPQKFNIATDEYGAAKAITDITQANPASVTSVAHGLSNGNTVWITGVQGMSQINNQVYTVTVTGVNTFTIGVDSTQYQAYAAGGYAVTQNAQITRQNAILTNAQGAIGTYNMLIDDYNLWDSLAVQALVNALAGYLAVPLSGNLQLAGNLVASANDSILLARAQDANEGYTIQDWTPDWIRARGAQFIPNDAMGGMLVTPYPPLFSVS